jgi:hypothetical protein
LTPRVGVPNQSVSTGRVRPDQPVRRASTGRRYEVLASLTYASKPLTGDGSGALYSDVVAALSYLTEVIDQGLQFWPFGG